MVRMASYSKDSSLPLTDAPSDVSAIKSLSYKTSRQSPLRNSTTEDSGSESPTSDESENSMMSSGSSPALDFTSRQAGINHKRHQERTHKGRHHKSKRKHASTRDVTSERTASPSHNFRDRTARRHSTDQLSSTITPKPQKVDNLSTNSGMERETNEHPSPSMEPTSPNEKAKGESSKPMMKGTENGDSREQTREVTQPEPPKPPSTPVKKEVAEAPIVSPPSIPGPEPSAKFKGIDFVAIALSDSGSSTPDVVYSWIDNPNYVAERDGSYVEAAIAIPLYKFTYSGEGWFNTLKNLKIGIVASDKEILDLDFVASSLFGLSHVIVHERMQIVLPPPAVGRRSGTLPRVLRQRKSVINTPNGTQSDPNILLTKETGSATPAAYNLVGQLSAVGYFPRSLGFDFVVSQRTGASVMMTKSQQGFSRDEQTYRRFLVSEKALGRCCSKALRDWEIYDFATGREVGTIRQRNSHPDYSSVYVKTHLKITEPLESKDADLLLTVMSVRHGTASWRHRTLDPSS